MKNFFCTASKVYLLLMIPVFILLDVIQANFSEMFALNPGAFFIVNTIPDYLTLSIIPLGALLAILGLLLTVPNLSTAIKVWKGILWVSFLVIVLPVTFLLLASLLVPPNPDDDGIALGLGLATLLIFDGPVILLAIIGLLFSEGRAKDRLDI